MEGKIYAITGAGSGIGRATALRCAESRCAGLSLCNVNLTGLEETKALLTTAQFPASQILITKGDISISSEVDTWIASTISKFGRLDGAANVAGISRRSPDTNNSNILDKDWDETIAVNLTETMNCMRAQLRVMKDQEPVNKGQRGSVVNVSSGAGMRGVPGMPSYSATKWGMRGFTKTAAIVLGPFGIRVNCFMP